MEHADIVRHFFLLAKVKIDAACWAAEGSETLTEERTCSYD